VRPLAPIAALSALARGTRRGEVIRVLGPVACLVGLLACRAADPPGGPEAMCARTCESHAEQCTPSQCARGCNLILDRLAEQEGTTVLACIATSARSCDDRAWSRCATRVGIHADGGPPPPAPPNDGHDDGD